MRANIFLRFACASAGVEKIAKPTQTAVTVLGWILGPLIQIEFVLPGAEQPTKILLHRLDGSLRKGIKQLKTATVGKQPTPVTDRDTLWGFRDQFRSLPANIRAALAGSKIAFIQELAPHKGDLSPLFYVDENRLFTSACVPELDKLFRGRDFIAVAVSSF